MSRHSEKAEILIQHEIRGGQAVRGEEGELIRHGTELASEGEMKGQERGEALLGEFKEGADGGGEGVRR